MPPALRMILSDLPDFPRYSFGNLIHFASESGQGNGPMLSDFTIKLFGPANYYLKSFDDGIWDWLVNYKLLASSELLKLRVNHNELIELPLNGASLHKEGISSLEVPANLKSAVTSSQQHFIQIRMTDSRKQCITYRILSIVSQFSHYVCGHVAITAPHIPRDVSLFNFSYSQHFQTQILEYAIYNFFVHHKKPIGLYMIIQFTATKECAPEFNRMLSLYLYSATSVIKKMKSLDSLLYIQIDEYRKGIFTDVFTILPTYHISGFYLKVPKPYFDIHNCAVTATYYHRQLDNYERSLGDVWHPPPYDHKLPENNTHWKWCSENSCYIPLQWMVWTQPKDDNGARYPNYNSSGLCHSNDRCSEIYHYPDVYVYNQWSMCWQGRCYLTRDDRFLPLTTSWSAAEAFCVARGGHMVSINSDGEQKMLIKWITNKRRRLTQDHYGYSTVWKRSVMLLLGLQKSTKVCGHLI